MLKKSMISTGVLFTTFLMLFGLLLFLSKDPMPNGDKTSAEVSTTVEGVNSKETERTEEQDDPKSDKDEDENDDGDVSSASEKRTNQQDRDAQNQSNFRVTNIN